MNLAPLSPEEIEAIRSVTPWIKVLGTGTFLSLIVALWKVFGIYKRLEDVETYVSDSKKANLLSNSRHEEITEACKVNIDAKIERAIHEAHIKWMLEMKEVRDDVSSIKETQCHILGELKQITNVLNSH